MTEIQKNVYVLNNRVWSFPWSNLFSNPFFSPIVLLPNLRFSHYVHYRVLNTFWPSWETRRLQTLCSDNMPIVFTGMHPHYFYLYPSILLSLPLSPTLILSLLSIESSWKKHWLTCQVRAWTSRLPVAHTLESRSVLTRSWLSPSFALVFAVFCKSTNLQVIVCCKVCWTSFPTSRSERSWSREMKSQRTSDLLYVFDVFFISSCSTPNCQRTLTIMFVSFVTPCWPLVALFVWLARYGDKHLPPCFRSSLQRVSRKKTFISSMSSPAPKVSRESWRSIPTSLYVPLSCSHSVDRHCYFWQVS